MEYMQAKFLEADRQIGHLKDMVRFLKRALLVHSFILGCFTALFVKILIGL